MKVHYDCRARVQCKLGASPELGALATSQLVALNRVFGGFAKTETLTQLLKIEPEAHALARAGRLLTRCGSVFIVMSVVRHVTVL